MKIRKINFLLVIILFISACSSVPKNTASSCSIFKERYFWYKHAKKSERKWGTPVHLQLAIIKMESSFDWLAKPPRQKLFKVSPTKDHLVHLVILKQLKEHGNNIKMKQEISMQLEQDLRIVLISLDGTQIRQRKF